MAGRTFDDPTTATGLASRPLSRRLSGPGLFLVPGVAFMALVYFVPIVGLLLTSFGRNEWTTVHYQQVFADTNLWFILWDTLVLAAKVTVMCTLLAYPLAYMTLRVSARMRKIIMILMVIPLWTSVLVRAYAWMVLLGRRGIVNETMLYFGIIEQPLQLLYREAAVVIGLVHLLLPFSFFPLYAVMSRYDSRLNLATRSLGGGTASSFLLVFVPLTISGVVSGGLIVFLHAIGYFVTPAILGGLEQVTYVILIEQQINNLFNWEKAAVMSVILLIITVAIVSLFGRSLGLTQSSGGEGTGTSLPVAAGLRVFGYLARLTRRTSHEEGTRPRFLAAALSRAGKGLLLVACICTVGFLLIPTFILLPLSFSASPFLEFPPQAYSLRWYETFFSRSDWYASMMTSLRVATITTVIIVVLAGAAAIGATRSRFRGLHLCMALLLSPAMIPTLVIGVALFFQLSRMGFVGTIPGLVAAHLVVAFPIVLIILTGALRRIDSRPEMAARSLGAGPIKAFMKTTFVVIRPSVIAAALFAFLASFDDVTVALFIAGAAARTLPLKMWESVRLELDPTLAAASSILIMISLLLLLIAELARRAFSAPGTDRDGPVI